MSSRNPKTGRRTKVKPGDRVIFTLPAGPPAAAIDLYGGDVQAAVTAGLTLLAIVTTTAPGSCSFTLPAVTQPQPPDSTPAPDPLASIMTQSLFGS